MTDLTDSEIERLAKIEGWCCEEDSDYWDEGDENSPFVNCTAIRNGDYWSLTPQACWKLMKKYGVSLTRWPAWMARMGMNYAEHEDPSTALVRAILAKEE